MNMLTWKKALSVILAAVSCGTLMMTQPANWNRSETVQAAVTIAELEARKQENLKKIQEYENKLSRFSENQKQAEAYQRVLQDKIDAIQSNMQILDTELEGIKKNIYYLDAAIVQTKREISAQEVRIEEGLEAFKLRIRAMYVNGNDSLISALAGATDFYDLLSKYELIACVAKHDDELVNNLKAELESYNQNKETLESQKAELESAQADKESTQKEMQEAMNELQDSYADSQAEQERLALEKEQANKSIEELKQDNQLAEAAEAEIREEIRRAEEEAKRKAAETSTAITTRKAVTTTSTSTTITEAMTEAVISMPETLAEVITVPETTEEIISMPETTEEVQPAPETAPIIYTAPMKETTAETTTEESQTIKETTTTSEATTTTTSTTTTKETTVTTTTTTKATTSAAATTTAPETTSTTEATTEPVIETETVPDYDETAFGWPCPEHYYISSGYGSRWGTTHKGMDIAQNAGADAVASRAGKVIKVNTSCKHNYGKSKNCCGNGYGNYVLIDHEDGTYSTMYAHLQKVIVSEGDYVEKGQTVGYVGTTGWSTGYHLHFEIRKDGVAVNPSNYLNY